MNDEALLFALEHTPFKLMAAFFFVMFLAMVCATNKKIQKPVSRFSRILFPTISQIVFEIGFEIGYSGIIF